MTEELIFTVAMSVLFMAEVDTDTMYTIKDNSCIEHIIPITTDNDGGFDTEETLFF